MINDSFFGNPTKFGTAGGLLTILLFNIPGNDIIKTIVLASIGAIASLVVSLFPKMLMNKWKR